MAVAHGLSGGDAQALLDSKKLSKGDLRKLGAAFFFLGVLNNVLYVIILSAALDLVPSDVPKGIILFCNIFPALLVKVGWPYFVPGRVRYGRRVLSCSLISFIGMLLVAVSSGLNPRLFGISLASFSSGLGEMTFLQRSTVYGDDALAKLAVGWFASGTGAAGLVGAGLWWEVRGLGVTAGLGISSALPVCMGLVYFTLLPPKDRFRDTEPSYSTVPTDEEANADFEDADEAPTQPLSPNKPEVTSFTKPQLSPRQKLDLAKPLFLPFMLPLFVVYFAEYTINTGVSPTLLYPLPNPSRHPILGSVVHQLSDYYPLWQLVYQTFVFFSRSSIVIFRVPPLPARLIALPSGLQFFVLLLAICESTRFLFSSIFGTYAILACACLVAMEGLFGGLAYINTYLQVGLITDSDEDVVDRKVILARREFRIACVGFADTLGILAASLVSYWLEPTLCGIQVASGQELCRQVTS